MNLCSFIEQKLIKGIILASLRKMRRTVKSAIFLDCGLAKENRLENFDLKKISAISVWVQVLGNPSEGMPFPAAVRYLRRMIKMSTNYVFEDMLMSYADVLMARNPGCDSR
ncbi:MAG: hypothetical protein ACFB0G_19175 [Leptolyngbyaceae cyanobacterium]